MVSLGLEPSVEGKDKSTELRRHPIFLCSLSGYFVEKKTTSAVMTALSIFSN